MTTPFLLSDLKADESLRLIAYLDPEDVPTIGWGHTGPEVHLGLIWTVEQAEAALRADVQKACDQLDAHAPWWRALCDVRQDVIANMVFNLGIRGFLKFKATIAAIQAHDYAGAAADMLNSLWAEQVKGRAVRLSTQMKTGLRLASNAVRA